MKYPFKVREERKKAPSLVRLWELSVTYLLNNLERCRCNWENPTGIPYDGIYGEAPPERGTFSGFRYMKGYSDFTSRSM